MRKLLWFTLGFGAACGFCAYGRQPMLLILPVLVLLLAAFAGSDRKFGILLAVLGVASGMIWFSRFEIKTLESIGPLEDLTQEAEIHCIGFQEKTDYGYRAEGKIQIGENTYTVMCYLDQSEKIVPGCILSGPFRFRLTAPGGMKESAYYQGEGIFLLAYQADEITVREGQRSWRDFPAKLRQKIRNLLEESLPPDVSTFAKALLIGDTSDLDYETKTDFSVSGIRHIVAVSGLHVSILFSLVYLSTVKKRFLSVIIGLPVLALFAAITGFTPSVCRACIMSGMMMTASLLNREYDGPTALSFSGLVLLLANPLMIASVSYQLSFASVAGIFLFSTDICKWLVSVSPKKIPGKLWKNLAASVSITLGATIMTVPLCALYFGTISLAAVVTNLLVLWVIGFLFYGLILMCILGHFWAAGAVLLGKILSCPIRYVLLTAKVIADFPLAAIYTRSPYIVTWLVFAYALLAVFLMSRNRNPLQLSCCAALGLCLALLASWAEPLTDDVRFTVLDVGQGQCLLLQTEGKTYMVDCGGTSDALAADTAAETLLSQGVSKIDALILTHYDRDHTGGVENLLTRLNTELLILPAIYSETTYPSKKTLYVQEDLLLSSGDAEIRIFASQIPGTDNENSLCILFDSENCDILITGDRDGFGERTLLRNAALSDVDILVAGHHGSKHATCEELLTAVTPEIVCISAGKDNLFGHPAPELLQRLENFGCTVYRTDLQGDIIIRR